MKPPKKANDSEVLKTNLSFEELMKKALNTPLPKKAKKKAAKKK